MTKINLIAAAILALSAGTALAGEGAGNPFPFSAPNGAVADVPVAVQQMTGQTPLLTKNPPNSVPYGWRDMTTAMRQYATAPIMGGNVLPTNGSQGAVQTANSLPSGFEAGTVPYEQAQSVQRYLAQQNAGVPHQSYAQVRHPAGLRTGG